MVNNLIRKTSSLNASPVTRSTQSIVNALCLSRLGYQMVCIWIVIGLRLAGAGSAFADVLENSVTPHEIVNDLKGCVSGVKEMPSDADISQAISGHYSQGGGLEGEDLYLFPDSTYYFLEWADISPLTITEKGQWRYDDGFVKLLPETSQIKSPLKDLLVPLYVTNHHKENCLLMGIDAEFLSIHKHANDQKTSNFKPFILSYMKSAYERVNSISMDDMDALKKKLQKKTSTPVVKETPCDR